MIELTGSYVCGTADAPLLGETIGQSLDLAVQRWGDREALVSPSHDVRWTWRELRLGACASHLAYRVGRAKRRECVALGLARRAVSACRRRQRSVGTNLCLRAVELHRLPYRRRLRTTIRRQGGRSGAGS